MTAWLPFACPEDVCKAVQCCTGFVEHFGKLAARPLNQYEPHATMWWLVPYDDDGRSPWPAYRVGKFRFAFSDKGQVQVGLHVEKGLSAEAASMMGDRGKSMKLAPDWRWYRFMADLRGGLVSTTVAEVARRQRLPVRVEVNGGPPEKLYEDGPDHVVFDVKDGRLAAAGTPTRMKLLPPLFGVASGPELADALASFPRDGWTWIDVYVSTSFELGPRADLDPADEWKADRLWEGWLSGLARWVK
jgi:hypothetical protein